ncbi:MAG TPA: hypothetical protein VGB26_02930 [Nitrospiria bacterium]|jgi:hypothetical protein
MPLLGKKEITLLLLITGIFFCFPDHSYTSQSGFEWTLRATGLQQGHAFAIFEHPEITERKWVGVGESINGSQVVRVERFRVILDTPRGRSILSLGGNEGQGFPPLVESPRDGYEHGTDLNALLNEKIMGLVNQPILIPEDVRGRLVKSLKESFDAGQMVPGEATLVIGGGEEWVPGIKTKVDFPIIGIEKEDQIILINGMVPDLDGKKWKNVLGVIQDAKLLIFAFIRGEEIFSEVFEVND